MTFDEFEKQFRRRSAFDRYVNIFCAIGFFVMSAFLFNALFIGSSMKFSDGKVGPFILALLLLFVSILTAALQKARYRLTIWNNGSSKQENIEKIKSMLEYLGKPENGIHEDHASVLYESSWWSSYSFDIHLFADTHFIAVNVRNIKGLYDFGKAKELRDSLEIYSFDIKSEV